ncbi:MAG: 2OG-Fe dioxygenase family protein, partial [Pseudomonadota bacterium]
SLTDAQAVERLGAATRADGFAALDPSLAAAAGASPEAWSALAAAARRMPPDPNMGLANYRRGFGVALIAAGRILPLDGAPLKGAAGTAMVAGFDIGAANPETPGARVFARLGDDVFDNPAFAAMLRLAVALDPCDPRAKGLMAVQVFVQTAMVDEAAPRIQAAPPDLPHNDECRFKSVFLIERRNVTGGATHFLPRRFVDKPFGDEARAAAFASLTLKRPGEGFCFLDDMPGAEDGRAPNCHYAEPVTLGSDGPRGWRTIATVTPAPLLPSAGDAAAVDDAYRRFAANATALLDQDRIAEGLPDEKREAVVRTLLS